MLFITLTMFTKKLKDEYQFLFIWLTIITSKADSCLPHTMATLQAVRPSAPPRYQASSSNRTSSGVREVSTEELLATRLALGQSYFDQAKK